MSTKSKFVRVSDCVGVYIYVPAIIGIPLVEANATASLKVSYRTVNIVSWDHAVEVMKP